MARIPAATNQRAGMVGHRAANRLAKVELMACSLLRGAAADVRQARRGDQALSCPSIAILWRDWYQVFRVASVGARRQARRGQPSGSAD